jgi:hypothetical protein
MCHVTLCDCIYLDFILFTLLIVCTLVYLVYGPNSLCVISVKIYCHRVNTKCSNKIITKLIIIIQFIYLRANLTAQRPITKGTRLEKKKKIHIDKTARKARQF